MVPPSGGGRRWPKGCHLGPILLHQAEVSFPTTGAYPETVDVVFIDFIQPWIIPALKFAGGDYNDDDVKEYMEGTLTHKLAEWIGDNWRENC